MVARSEGRIPAGSVVRVLDKTGDYLGTGLYHPDVTIALRLLSRDPEETIDQAFFVRRFERALWLRRDVLRLEEVTNAFRLVHGEADGLSGLVVDVLGDVVRAETYALGMARQQVAVRAALETMFPDKRVVIRAESRTAGIEGYSLAPAADDPASCEVREHGVRFHVDLRQGHKTGFFCDQRENRDYLARLVRGKRVLDAHTYTGAFALHAACRGEAAEVTGVDLDEKALEVAKRNAKLNQVRVKFLQSDAFNYLRQLKDKPRGLAPEVMILDPPKLAHDRNEREDGLRAYGDLNRLGLEAMADEGLLVTCSCSGVITEQDLLEAVKRGAARSNREVTVFRLAGAAGDHPFGLHAPEGRYLKAVFARVRKL
jgi:23S rRNA (cytosine1962-C5)-methyltransferase